MESTLFLSLTLNSLQTLQVKEVVNDSSQAKISSVYANVARLTLTFEKPGMMQLLVSGHHQVFAITSLTFLTEFHLILSRIDVPEANGGSLCDVEPNGPRHFQASQGNSRILFTNFTIFFLI